MTACIIIFCILLLGECGYIALARRHGIVDVPNNRSSHSRNVVRGGGVVFFLAYLMWWLWDGCADWQGMAGMTLLAAVSFADDLRDVSVGVRLPVQFGGAALIFWDSGLAAWPVPLIAAALIAGVGLMNAFNFMDGINGSLGLYALLLFGSAAYLDASAAGGFVAVSLPAVMGIAALTFCLFNFRPSAVCFSGDIGSIVCGAAAMYIVGRLIIATGNPGWLALVAVYGVDAVMTLCRRLSMRQNIFRSHRMHAYQLASNELGISQLKVSAAIFLLQAAIDIPMLFFGAAGWPYLLGTVAVLAIIYITIVKLAHRPGTPTPWK